MAVLADLLRAAGHDPVVLRGGMGSGQRRSALERLRPDAGLLLVLAAAPYVGEGFNCPVLDTLFLAAPIAFKDSDAPGGALAGYGNWGCVAR